MKRKQQKWLVSQTLINANPGLPNFNLGKVVQDYFLSWFMKEVVKVNGVKKKHIQELQAGFNCECNTNII